MYYEINVLKDGKHLFATDKRSIEFYWDLEKVYRIFEQKFLEYEGYKITVTKWETRGLAIEDVSAYIEDVGAYIKEEQNN